MTFRLTDVAGIASASGIVHFIEVSAVVNVEMSFASYFHIWNDHKLSSHAHDRKVSFVTSS